MLSFLASLPGSNDMQDVANSGIVPKLHGSCTGQEEKCGFHPSPQDETVKTPSGISLYEVTL